MTYYTTTFGLAFVQNTQYDVIIITSKEQLAMLSRKSSKKKFSPEVEFYTTDKLNDKLYNAVVNQKIHEIKYCLSCKANPMQAAPLKSYNPFEIEPILHIACKNNSLNIVELLCQSYEKIIDRKYFLNTVFNGKTALDIAMEDKNPKLATYLFEQGAATNDAIQERQQIDAAVLRFSCSPPPRPLRPAPQLPKFDNSKSKSTGTLPTVDLIDLPPLFVHTATTSKSLPEITRKKTQQPKPAQSMPQFVPRSTPVKFETTDEIKHKIEYEKKRGRSRSGLLRNKYKKM